MTIGTLKSPNPRNQNSISVIKSKFLSVSSMNTLLAILKVTDARRDVILAGGLYHRFPWRHLPPPLVQHSSHPRLFSEQHCFKGEGDMDFFREQNKTNIWNICL